MIVAWMQCVFLNFWKGATRDKKDRSKALALVNPNYPPEKLAKHMAAELGWGIPLACCLF